MSVFIVAEMSASHCGSIKRAYDIVDAAKDCGADAVKLQTWAKMTCAPYEIKSGPWAGRDLGDLYEEARLPWDWHAPIFARCRRLGLECFSAPFDKPSVDFLETLGCPRYKIASPEIVDLELIRHAASKGKPMILSTGMATVREIGDAVLACRPVRDITLLKCVSAYPAPLEDFNLRTLNDMGFRAPHVGLSDHSKGATAAVVAVALGASVVEKHLSLDREGLDGGFASNPDEFREMVRAVRQAESCLGGVSYGFVESEKSATQFRRSLWFTRDVTAGEVIGDEDVASFRPALGLPPSWPVVGRRALRDVAAWTPVKEDALG